MRILVLLALAFALVGCSTTAKDTQTAIQDLSYIYPDDEIVHETYKTLENAEWLFTTDEYAGWGY